LDGIGHGAGLFVRNESFGKSAPDVSEGELDVVQIGERRRRVIAVTGKDEALVQTRVVVAVLLVDKAR
jgi:hypothetical protein